MELHRPVGYLEKQDFTADGNLVQGLRGIPIFVMIQSRRCPHCQTAKPAFQQLADSNIVKCMTIQVDGDRPSERALGQMIRENYPEVLGYPSFMMYAKGQRMFYDGPRDFNSMKAFVSNFVSKFG